VERRSASEIVRGATSRRGFLKTCGRAAIASIGAAAILTPFRKAFAASPVWTTVPNLVWTVGVPVSLDLAAYCTDPDGDPLTYSLSLALPPGLTLNGSVISGTPTATYAATQFTAYADDQADTTPPGAATDLRPR
jgi:putative Ig domain-containing protein